MTRGLVFLVGAAALVGACMLMDLLVRATAEAADALAMPGLASRARCVHRYVAAAGLASLVLLVVALLWTAVAMLGRTVA